MPTRRHLAAGFTLAIAALVAPAAHGRAAEPRVQPRQAVATTRVSAAPAPDAAAVLAADRAYAAQSAKTSFFATLATMFRPDVIAPGPGGLLKGADAVLAALRAVPENVEATVEWTPVGGGISADRTHGYTFGYMTARAPGGAVTPLKYMAYWVREGGAWKVAGYKRTRRPDGDVSLTTMTLRTPAAVPPTTEAARLEAGRRSLAAAEQAFSDRAQAIGLGPAFAEFGAPSAVNMGGPGQAGFVVGNTAIGALIGSSAPGATSPLAWASETVIVASSGDLGVSFGYIKAHAPPAGAPERGQPFFTIWVRDAAAAPWRYIAE